MDFLLLVIIVILMLCFWRKFSLMVERYRDFVVLLMAIEAH